MKIFRVIFNIATRKIACPPRSSGFTLAELMIAVSILGILAAVAIPNYFSRQSYRRLNAASRDLYSNLQLAKVEAIRRNTNVVVAFYTERQPPFTASIGPFGSYRVFVDNGTGGGIAGDSIWNGAELMLAQPVSLPADVTPSTVTVSTTGFNPRGLPLGLITITLNSADGARRTITVSIAGNVRLSEL